MTVTGTVLHIHWTCMKLVCFGGFCNCSCDVPESSFGSINLRSGHICCRLCIGTSLQGIGIPMHEWSHCIYYSSQASYVFFYFCKVSRPDLLLYFQESCMVLAYQLVFSSYCVCLWEVLFSGVSSS